MSYDTRYFPTQQLQFVLDSLISLQEGGQPLNEKRIAAATFLECLVSSLSTMFLAYEPQQRVVKRIIEVYNQIWFS